MSLEKQIAIEEALINAFDEEELKSKIRPKSQKGVRKSQEIIKKPKITDPLLSSKGQR